jgi:tripartite-type tricarboxylate transporter receptor subunit TctC
MIVAAAPGGANDVLGRMYAQRMTESLGQTVVVDNRGGGGGSVGAEITKAAPPDGYTINLMSASGVVRPLMYPSNYDVLRDFIPVSQITSNPYVLVVHPFVPAKSVQEFIAYAKANPGKLNFSSSGPGSQIHLGCELLNGAAGISTVHVPYKGTGAAYPDLIAGNVQWTLANITSSQPHVRAQRLRALAVSGAARAKAQPELPTIAESGVKGYEVTQWYGILMPARTESPIVDRLNKEIVGAVQQPDFAKRFSADGTETVGSSPAQFLALLKSETVRWAKVIKDTGVRGD